MLTQREWTAILLAGWQGNKTVGWALRIAAGAWPSERLTNDQFASIEAETNKLWPRVQGFSSKATVRYLVANKSRLASDALFDGDEKKAALLMTTPVLSRDRAQDRERARGAKRYARTRVVYARELDKMHDWATVK
jgi:hypothetical protein